MTAANNTQNGTAIKVANVIKMFIGMFFTLYSTVGIALIAVLLGHLVSAKCGWLFYGMFNSVMYLHLLATSAISFSMARDFDTPKDTVWKMLFMLAGTVGLSVGITL